MHPFDVTAWSEMGVGNVANRSFHGHATISVDGETMVELFIDMDTAPVGYRLLRPVYGRKRTKVFMRPDDARKMAAALLAAAREATR
jgi:hypothetical protein